MDVVVGGKPTFSQVECGALIVCDCLPSLFTTERLHNNLYLC
jgi:hypothetical protein